MPPAPRRSSTSPAPGAGAANVSIRRSSFAWMRAASIGLSFEAAGALLQRVPALAEALVRLVEVALHRRARGGGVVPRDRAQHRAVLGHRRGPQPGRVVVV